MKTMIIGAALFPILLLCVSLTFICIYDIIAIRSTQIYKLSGPHFLGNFFFHLYYSDLKMRLKLSVTRMQRLMIRI